MVICAITPYKKHLVKIEFESGEECLLDRDVCVNHALCCEMELESEDLKELQSESDFVRAKSRALWYLDRSDYTEKAIYQKLTKAGFGQKTSAAVVGRLVELDLINDRRFAERFFERCTEHNISKREALHKMYEKGVPYDLAKEIIQNNEVNEEEQIKNLLERKYSSKLDCENGKQKVFAALARKGFSYSAIRSAMNSYFEDLEFCEE